KDNSSGTITITATDGNSKTGTSGSIVVTPGAFADYIITTTTPQIAGVGWSETLSAQDTYGNTHDTDATITVAASLVGADPEATTKRKAITITGSTAGALTDYQVQVSVAYDANMQPDFDDIRFTDAEGASLSYYRDSYTASTSASFWVKVPSIPASPDTVTIYLNYGNSGISTASSGASTFLNFGLRQEGPITAGVGYSCAVLSDGAAKCWGANNDGQLGDGTKTQSLTPVVVSNLTGAVAISNGDYYACALINDGTARCWGYGGLGELGDGTINTSSVPVVVSGLTGAVAITAGYRHACAFLSNGTAKCWGDNDYGELGDETTTQRTTPVVVSGLTGAVAVTAGQYYTCALLSNGTAKCWGNNTNGQLGDGTTTNSFVPVAVSGLTGAVAITGGYSHACALLSDGTAACWGYNDYGKLGDGTDTQRLTPVVVSNLTGAVAITAGYRHTCALISDGTAKCWGRNDSGQLGDGTTVGIYTPVSVSGLTGAVALTAGDAHTCALLSDGTAKCWGSNGSGRLGDGTTTQSLVPVAVSSYALGARYDKTRGISSVPNPVSDSYFLRKYSAVEPSLGEAGSEEVTGASPSALFYTNDSYSTQTSTYSMVDGLATIYAKDRVGEIIKITATDGTNAVTTDSITVNPASIASYTVTSTTPQSAGTGWSETVSAINTLGDVAVDDSSTIITVSSTSATTKFYTDAACLTENTAKQYTLTSGVANIYIKDNSSGTITITATDGNSKTGTSSSIVVAPGAFSEYTITTTTPQTAGVGWSETLSSKDSYGNINPLDTTITVSSNLAGADPEATTKRKAITITGSTAGALTDYEVKVTVAYDANMQPDFDDIRFTDAEGTSLSYYRDSYTASTSAVFWVKIPSIPASPDTITIYLHYGNVAISTASSGASTFLEFNLRQEGPITAGAAYTCALVSDGTARCWGYNAYGQLGDGTTTTSYTPVVVSNLTGVVAIALGEFHTCALINDGTAKCWGYNWNGPLGSGNQESSNIPIAVSSLTSAVAITAGNSYTCALINDGTAKCWGYNNVGQLGNGTTTTSLTPMAVSGLTGVVAITAGGSYACALINDGTARCWGDNGSGRLGDGTTTTSSLPVVVSGLANAVAITAGGSHTCALINDGTARCWGYNEFGQLGDGTGTARQTPVAVSGLTGAISLTTGSYHTCALINDGTARCWGYGGSGRLGDGTTNGSTVPVAVSGLTSAIEITAGADHTCVLLSDGSSKCWGSNWNGPLGDGTTTDSSVPVVVLSYNLGAVYGKTGGISSIPNPSSDDYFLRKYSSAEPSLGEAGSEESVGASPSALFYTNDSYSTQTSTYSMIDGLATIYAKDRVGETIKITATDGTNSVT
ncbi:MAG: DUF2341 domain-containing protein, partial [Candidatus Paceibacterota bacterium]